MVMRRVLAWAPVALGVLFLLVLGYHRREMTFSGHNDFVMFYAGAKLAGTPQLYSQRRERTAGCRRRAKCQHRSSVLHLIADSRFDGNSEGCECYGVGPFLRESFVQQDLFDGRVHSLNPDGFSAGKFTTL